MYKMKNIKNFLIYLSILSAILHVGSSYAQEQNLNAKLNEQVVMVPVGSGLFGIELETTIFKPSGNGPFPIMIMNHGKASGNPHFQGRARYSVVSREFVKRGYAVVIPMRRGFSKSTGLYIDGGCNIAGNARVQADDLQSVLEFVIKQSWADKNRILIVGQSHGGLTTMAFGARNYPGVKGLINFAGGLRKDQCQWQLSLVDAFGDFGGKTLLPSLWFYGENDSYFNPELVSKMHTTYTKSGAKAKLVAYGPFKNDAHGMVGDKEGVEIWWPETEKFLKVVGLPVGR
jgi:dienelactone hydrolase